MTLNIPNLLTWLRILLIPVFVTVFYLSDSTLAPHLKNLIATGVFLLAAVTGFSEVMGSWNIMAILLPLISCKAWRSLFKRSMVISPSSEKRISPVTYLAGGTGSNPKTPKPSIEVQIIVKNLF